MEVVMGRVRSLFRANVALNFYLDLFGHMFWISGLMEFSLTADGLRRGPLDRLLLTYFLVIPPSVGAGEGLWGHM